MQELELLLYCSAFLACGKHWIKVNHVGRYIVRFHECREVLKAVATFKRHSLRYARYHRVITSPRKAIFQKRRDGFVALEHAHREACCGEQKGILAKAGSAVDGGRGLRPFDFRRLYKQLLLKPSRFYTGKHLFEIASQFHVIAYEG